MNAKLDPAILRATSAEHVIERRLELVAEDEIPRAAASYTNTRWERLDRDKATIVLATSLGRVGVTTFYAGKWVSYHECSPEEALEAVGNFQRAGFGGPKVWRP